MTGFINPDSIKPNGSSDREEVVYSHLESAGHTFSLMKLGEPGDLWRGIKLEMKWVSTREVICWRRSLSRCRATLWPKYVL